MPSITRKNIKGEYSQEAASGPAVAEEYPSENVLDGKSVIMWTVYGIDSAAYRKGLPAANAGMHQAGRLS